MCSLGSWTERARYFGRTNQIRRRCKQTLFSGKKSYVAMWRWRKALASVEIERRTLQRPSKRRLLFRKQYIALVASSARWVETGLYQNDLVYLHYKYKLGEENFLLRKFLFSFYSFFKYFRSSKCWKRKKKKKQKQQKNIRETSNIDIFQKYCFKNSFLVFLCVDVELGSNLFLLCLVESH